MTRNRRPRDRQIYGREPELLDVPRSALPQMTDVIRAFERLARDGFSTSGRGFLLNLNHPGIDEPLTRYVPRGDEMWDGFANEADLVEAVDTYEPSTHFVIFEATVDESGEQPVMTDIQISVWEYLLTRPQPPQQGRVERGRKH